MMKKIQAHLLKVSFTILAACSSAAGLAQDLRSYPVATVKFLDV
jgi:predicted small secreted protein